MPKERSVPRVDDPDDVGTTVRLPFSADKSVRVRDYRFVGPHFSATDEARRLRYAVVTEPGEVVRIREWFARSLRNVEVAPPSEGREWHRAQLLATCPTDERPILIVCDAEQAPLDAALDVPLP